MPPIGSVARRRVRCRGVAVVLSALIRCDESKNKLAAEFNDGLGRLLANLGSSLHGFRYSLADLYGLASATFANPSAGMSTHCTYQ